MPHTHPYLKGLAETRARADGQCSTLENQISTLSRRLEKARTEREACDSLIRRFAPSILPDAISPINEGYRSRYGERGALTKAIIAALQQAYPSSISTSEIALHVEAAFQLTFTTRTERRNWVCRAISTRLGSFIRDGIIERLHDPRVNNGKPGLWKWIPSGHSHARLSSLASQAGLAVSYTCASDSIQLDCVDEDYDIPR